MIKLFSLLLLGLSARSFACGEWILEDLQSQKRIRFKVHGVELIDPKRPDPEFMRSGADKAFFIQGHQLDYSHLQLRYLKPLPNKRANKMHEVEVLGTLNESLLDTTSGGSYQVHTEKNAKFIALIVTHQGAPVARGKIAPACAADVNLQKKRVAAYFAWKQLKLDPYAKPVENWWW